MNDTLTPEVEVDEVASEEDTQPEAVEQAEAE